MRFSLVDRITQLEPGVRIEAVKNVSLSEEYLADHFPLFPVLPGVMMLEALTQASAWLIRVSEDFSHSMVLLKEARNVKYASFLAPGERLEVSAEIKGQDERETRLRVTGSAEGEVKVSGRLVLERFNLADHDPKQASTDEYVIHEQRKLLSLLCPGGLHSVRGAPLPSTGGGAIANSAAAEASSTDNTSPRS